MESPAGAPQPTSKMTGFARPKASPAQPAQPLIDPALVAHAAANPPPELSSEDARALASEGSSGSDTAALAAKQDKNEAEKKDPALTYEDRVKQFGLTIEQALAIVDSLAVNGNYRETFPISKTTQVTYSTRSTRFNSYLAKQVDIADVKKVGMLNQLMCEMQLSASLIQYGEFTMPELDDSAPEDLWTQCLDKRRAFVKRIPSPVFLHLANKLAKFDAKLIVVFSEGYEANF